MSPSVKIFSNICHHRPLIKALICLQNSESSLCFCTNLWHENAKWGNIELSMKWEFCYSCLTLAYVKHYDSEGSALGFVMNHAPLLMCLHYVILWLHHWVWAFSQVSLISVWSQSSHIVELLSPVCQSCLKNFGAKTSVSLTHTSTASRINHHQISSGKAKRDHVGCCPAISSCLVLDILHRKNVCSCFERFSAKYLHLNPPPLAIISFTWELAGITVPGLCHFFTNSCLWIWGLLELDNLGC